MTFSQPDPSPYPAASAAIPASAPATANSAGRTSLVAGIIVVVIGLGQQLFNYAIPSLVQQFDLPGSQVTLLYLPFSIVNGLLAVVAIIFGIIGLTRPWLPKASSGAGIAIGASTLLSILFSYLSSAIAYALF